MPMHVSSRLRPVFICKNGRASEHYNRVYTTQHEAVLIYLPSYIQDNRRSASVKWRGGGGLGRRKCNILLDIRKLYRLEHACMHAAYQTWSVFDELLSRHLLGGFPPKLSNSPFPQRLLFPAVKTISLLTFRL